MCADSQEVGLEAAILERVRNSSLVECTCADNSPGLKPVTEAADWRDLHASGRGASPRPVKHAWKRVWRYGECGCRYE